MYHMYVHRMSLKVYFRLPLVMKIFSLFDSFDQSLDQHVTPHKVEEVV